MKARKAQLPDSSSTTALLNSKTDDISDPKQITYPHQVQLKKILDSVWIYSLILIPCLLDAFGNNFYNLEDFFYPCRYANMLSINDTLKLQSRFNDTQNEIQSFKSLLTKSGITVADNERYNFALENAIKRSSTLNKEYQFHKSNWEVCFHQNRYNYDQKVLLSQFCFSLVGFLLCLYELISCLQYTSKLKKLQLTKEQKEVYEKDWKEIDGFKWRIIFKCILLFFYAFVGVIYMLRLLFVVSDPVQMPYFT